MSKHTNIDEDREHYRYAYHIEARSIRLHEGDDVLVLCMEDMLFNLSHNSDCLRETGI